MVVTEIMKRFLEEKGVKVYGKTLVGATISTSNTLFYPDRLGMYQSEVVVVGHDDKNDCIVVSYNEFIKEYERA